MSTNTYIIYKPYDMLSQFTREIPTHRTLADLDFEFPKDVYPVGRLDRDSEGLLILSNNKHLNKQLLDPKNKQAKTYWVQVEGEPTNRQLQPLIQGIRLRIKKQSFTTLPAELSLLNKEQINQIPDRNPAIRFRKNKPTTWVEISIVEGKNRQVRKMFAAIGFPVLRLIRVGIAGFTWQTEPILQLAIGGVQEINI